MKFTPRLDEDNVNVSKTPPLKELLFLLTTILGVLLLIYIALGFCLDIVVQKIPPRIEKSLGSFYSRLYEEDEVVSDSEKKLQDILNNLLTHMPESGLEFKVYVKEDEKANALALPGGNIVVLSGLLEEVESENELAMILAHELGHFANRDHLRGLGRSLVFIVLSSIVFGQESNATQFLQKALLTVELKFSRNQEAAADLFGLDLLNSTYGHVGGATDFFERLHDKEKAPKFLYFFATHPPYKNRVESLNKRIEEKAYPEKELKEIFLGDDPG